MSSHSPKSSLEQNTLFEIQLEEHLKHKYSDIEGVCMDYLRHAAPFDVCLAVLQEIGLSYKQSAQLLAVIDLELRNYEETH